jgi:GGDEF domain-containing protein
MQDLERALVPLIAAAASGVPAFVVMRSLGAAFTSEDAFALGADEVMEATLPRDLVRYRLRRSLREAELRRRLRADATFAAATDPVSGRLGHGAFHAIIADALRATPFPARGALVAITLDGLDAVNRDVGFAAGDRAIAAAGVASAREVRAEDCVGRLGGATLGIWLGDISDADVISLGERVQAATRRAWLEGDGPPLDARIGWARPSVGDDALTLSRRARAEARRTLLRMAS